MAAKTAPAWATKQSGSRKGRGATKAAKPPKASSRPAKSGDRVPRSLAKALAHPIRIHILATAHPGPTSPSEMARQLGEPLPKVSYHFDQLVKYEAIELVGEEPVRGATKHLYVGTKRAIYTQADWLQLPESIRIGLAHAGLLDFSDVVIAANQSGSFSKRDFVFDWKENTLDEKGYEAMLQVEKLAAQKIARLEEESEARLAASGDAPISTITGFFGFLGPGQATSDDDSAKD